jgi:hypothetical protein
LLQDVEASGISEQIRYTMTTGFDRRL